MIVLGLTGSIGMGKSTTGQMFRDENIPVHDADQTVHDLYAKELVPALEEAFPGVAIEGKVDRKKLSEKVIGNQEAFEKLEAIVHPAVRKKEERFLKTHRQNGESLVVLDIPLLFETGSDGRVDRVLVVSAPKSVQQKRVLSRPEMTEKKFQEILEKQLPDEQKRARADFIIDTSLGLEDAKMNVRNIIQTLVPE